MDVSSYEAGKNCRWRFCNGEGGADNDLSDLPKKVCNQTC